MVTHGITYRSSFPSQPSIIPFARKHLLHCLFCGLTGNLSCSSETGSARGPRCRTLHLLLEPTRDDEMYPASIATIWNRAHVSVWLFNVSPIGHGGKEPGMHA
jgi:hypothetical protein